MALKLSHGDTDYEATYQQFVSQLGISGAIYSNTPDTIALTSRSQGELSLLEAKDALLEIVEWIVAVENGELA